MPHPSVTAQTYPHKPAIIMGGSGEMVTYQQLDDEEQGRVFGEALPKGLRVGPDC